MQRKLLWLWALFSEILGESDEDLARFDKISTLALVLVTA
jgi:hypothetical protein